MRRKFWLLAAVCLLVCLLAGCGSKEQTVTPDFVLTYADNQPADYPTTQGAERFAALVKERTGGKVVIQVKSGGEYGTEQEVWQQLSIGGIDFARVSLSQLAGLLENLSVLQLPYLYEDAKQMWRVLDGSIGDGFLSTLENVDLVGLSWFDAGDRSFYTREKAATLADLQGKVIRVQESDMMSEMVSDMGAVPVQVVYSQVYAALHNGRIDGAENNWPSYEAKGHYEVAPYFLKNEHTRVPEIQIASRAALEKLAGLDSSFPGIVRGCARDSANVERRLWAEREAQAEEDMRAWGVEVTTLSEAEMQKFRAAVRPMYERFAEEAELIRQIQDA